MLEALLHFLHFFLNFYFSSSLFFFFSLSQIFGSLFSLLKNSPFSFSFLSSSPQFGSPPFLSSRTLLSLFPFSPLLHNLALPFPYFLVLLFSLFVFCFLTFRHLKTWKWDVGTLCPPQLLFFFFYLFDFFDFFYFVIFFLTFFFSFFFVFFIFFIFF